MGCGAAFAAVSGSSVATAGEPSGARHCPQMKRFGYFERSCHGFDRSAGGTLGFLIPPSTGFVIYAILTEAEHRASFSWQAFCLKAAPDGAVSWLP